MNKITIQSINPLVIKARELIINSPKDVPKAVEMLSTLNKTSDQIAEEKEKVTKPLNEALKAERGRWKPIETILDEAIAIVRKTITTYQTAEVARVAAEEAKILARVKEGKGNLKLETAVEKLGEIDTPNTIMETTIGTVKFKTIKKFEVIDKMKLPPEYLLADEVAIRKAMLEGKELEGVRYYTEQIPINSR